MLPAIFTNFRLRQIQFTSAVANRFGSPSLLKWPYAKRVADALLGYNRPFQTLKEAEQAVLRYANGGHANKFNADLHLTLGKKLRPSDYAALFHIAPRLPQIRTIFDLGGNCGNLFYSYRDAVQIPDELRWLVHDLPEMMERGKQVALERNERRLEFTDRFTDASGVDLFIASGSLHYFDEPLPNMIGALPDRPRLVLVNRTPLTTAATYATVQDADRFRVACKVYNTETIVNGFERLGYRCVDVWNAVELSFKIPLYPHLSVPSYSGAFFVID